MKAFWVLAGIVALTGCQLSAPSFVGDELITANQQTGHKVRAPVAFFSTYPSNNASETCRIVNRQKQACIDDPISPQQFLDVLSEQDWFTAVLPSSSGSDYELLISNQSATVADGTPWQSTISALSMGTVSTPVYVRNFTEVTVQWRGVEIDTRLLDITVPALTEQNAQDIARTALTRWWQDVSDNDVFSARYLYSALDASNYFDNMQLPAQIGDFIKDDTQLYHDPFKGVISRYLHPQYENALLDISVYPILSPLSQSDDTLLHSELQQDLAQAKDVASARDMTLDDDGGITPFSIAGSDRIAEGKVMALTATSENAESLFASTYVFRQQDKIIKITTTFPRRVSDSLVQQAMPSIIVPEPSKLMAAIREMQASQQTAVQ
ncbi:hypothetical protein [Alteromonas antoniana]|uniref:hypothetical protein n=1 Tax=Alteromonas antoniana TaxID=2803813 RepID=UPI001C4553AC|nr:hypothetical protein [Alteromonas antoniana]